MGSTFSIKRGFANGNKIFVATYNEKNYQHGELGKLSEEVLAVFDNIDSGGGLFNPNTEVTLRYGTQSNTFTFEALNLYSDTPVDMKSKLLARFQAIIQWKATMNASEEFELVF